MNNTVEQPRVPLTHRIGLFFLGLLLAGLLVWLGDYALGDIGRIPCPDPVVATMPGDLGELLEERDALVRQANAKKEEQRYIEGSTKEAQNTVNQLLKLQESRAGAVSPEEQATFAESQRLFLANQKQVQDLLQEILDISRRQQALEERIRERQRRLDEERAPILRAHQRRIALYKLLFMLPFLAVGCVLFARARGGTYAPLVYAFDAAVLYLLVTIIYEHMPPAYYKYVFTAMGIVVVLAAMLVMIRQVVRPNARWTARRRGEAYHAAECPVCRYPIVGDDMRSVIPPRRLLKRQATARPGATTARYCCPGCGATLFEPCDACGELRHSLLPHCLHCGAAKETTEA